MVDECELTLDKGDVPILHFANGHEKLDNIDDRILRLADGDHTIEDIVAGLSESFEHENLVGEVRDVLHTINDLGLLRDAS